jgi:hypothetical protein
MMRSPTVPLWLSCVAICHAKAESFHLTVRWVLEFSGKEAGECIAHLMAG